MGDGSSVILVIVSVILVLGFAPESFAANANLFVSAENSQFDNYMSGPQVIEVVVIDSPINDTDEAKGEPEVKVNGKILRMVQAVDGNWYGYFADRVMAQTADATTTNSGEGLDFGTVCTSFVDIIAAEGFVGVELSDTAGVALGATSCAGTGANPLLQNVLREEKNLNTLEPKTPGLGGQIGIDEDSWPFIQLYNLNPTGNVVVQYNKGGGAQTTTLTFDTVEAFAGIELDRLNYPVGSQVHATITDLWLNVDPTDEDSWTFGTGGTSTNYQVFDENGHVVGDTSSNTDSDLTDALGDLMCEDNCILLINTDVQGKGAVLTLQDNDDSEITPTADDGDPQNPSSWETIGGNISGDFPVTITEQGPNSGVFGTFDESDISNLVITDSAENGMIAMVDYNESPQVVLISTASGGGGGGLIPPDPEPETSNGGDNQWDTRPTFGVSHEDRSTQVVETGFTFNANEYMLTDNHHTDFAEQEVEIGTTNSFSATVYADKKLKIQEFLFGIPSVGEAHLAELGVEVWYDNNGEIEDIKVVQNSDVIDVESLSVSHEMTKCLPTDAEAKCDTTTVSMTFLEPLFDKVMAVKAIDYALRDQRTFLNEGFDISGDSLNPMLSKMIPSTVRNEGLFQVTQVAKYSPYWSTEDGQMFEMNSFGSFKQINQSFERFQDTGNAFTRMHSGFGGIIAYEQDRAQDIFDSSKLVSELPESFAYIFPETGQRISDELKEEILIQEQIAKEILDGMVKPQRNY